MNHDELCPQATSEAAACLCDLLKAVEKRAKNEILHFFANEIMKLFLSERAR